MIPVAQLVTLALALGPWAVAAAPTPDNIALARKYAPQWKFHPSEVYWPSTVEYFLAGVKETDSSGNVINGALTNSNVDDAANQGSGLYLSTDINAGKAGFLRGQNPSTTSTKVYTFIAPKANGVVDLFYWLFTPFNEGKSIPLLGEVGDHVGDWERMTVRTVNGVATQVDYHAHDDKGSGTVPWDQAIKFDNNQRPVGYVAKGSHGFWAKPGTYTYVNAVVFQLQDVTADGGVAWDTKDSLVTYSYPDTFSGSDDWLNYKGAWGNIGTDDCWWYVFHNECEVVGGPGGPLRPDVLGAASVDPTAASSGSSMSGPLSQTLGTVSKDGKSSYTLYIDSAVHTLASQSGQSKLAVQQTCTSTLKTETPKDNSTAPAAPVISTNVGSISLTDSTKNTISVEGCAENFAVSSYSVGLCKNDSQTDCTWSSPRALRAFSSEGLQQTKAIVVTDLDVWSL